MDPVANIRQQIGIARVILALQDGEWDESTTQAIAENGHALAELVLALDEWRRKGGFDPYIRP